LLANVVLNELDRYMDLEASTKYNVGSRRRPNPVYKRLQRLGPKRTARENTALMKLRSKDPFDPGFKRLKYVRYADDFLVFLSCSRLDAERLRHAISRKLESLGLTLSVEKTKITPIRNKSVSFLGFNLHIRRLTEAQTLPRRVVTTPKYRFLKRVVPRIIISAPIKGLLDRLVERGYARRSEGEYLPCSLPKLIPMDHDTILAHYSSVIRGVLEYYSPAMNRVNLFSICRILKYSCALVLARKYKIRGRTVRAAISKFGPVLKNPESGRTLYYPTSLAAKIKFNATLTLQYKDLVDGKLILRGTQSAIGKCCAICGQSPVEMHHIRAVKNSRIIPGSGGANWDSYAGLYLRKQIPLCRAHHRALHNSSLTLEEVEKLSPYVRLKRKK
jgi:hypothetical protein